jgi:hypothetical protein
MKEMQRERMLKAENEDEVKTTVTDTVKKYIF